MQFGITLQWANINFVDFFHALFEDFQNAINTTVDNVM